MTRRECEKWRQKYCRRCRYIPLMLDTGEIFTMTCGGPEREEREEGAEREDREEREEGAGREEREREEREREERGGSGERG